jgi:p-aminobenzoyl-glutamate transporter AbgT
MGLSPSAVIFPPLEAVVVVMVDIAVVEERVGVDTALVVKLISVP